MSFTYLASPYSSPSLAVQKARFEEIARITSLLLYDNVYVYSPIVHCHYIAETYSFPTSFAFWQHYNRSMIRAASAFAIAMLPGWEDSIGLKAEHEYAKELGLPILVWYEDGKNYGLAPLT